MTDKTEAMDRLIAQDADLIDMPAMTDVETIAEGLTDMEREWITGWQGARGAAFNRVAGDLRRKGLLKGPLDWSLNDRGLAVLNHLRCQCGLHKWLRTPQ
jgi:hypothetical protein